MDVSQEGPDLFLRSMEVLLKQYRGTGFGALSVVVLSEVNKRLNYYTKQYRQTPAYWRARFESDLLPKITEKYWASSIQILPDPGDKTEFFDRFQKAQLDEWDSYDQNTNYFFLYIAYLIFHIFSQHRTHVTQLLTGWDISLFKCDRTITCVLEQGTKYAISSDAITKITGLSSFEDPLIRKWLQDHPSKSDVEYQPRPRIPAIPFFYDALSLGWRFSAKIKEHVPRDILACLTCGKTALPLQQCGGCLDQTTLYCGSACQQAHWSKHKEKCKWKK